MRLVSSGSLPTVVTRRRKGGPPVDERYLSQIEQSRTSAKPLPLEVIENVQEAIWAGISGSVKAVLRRLVDMALADGCRVIKTPVR